GTTGTRDRRSNGGVWRCCSRGCSWLGKELRNAGEADRQEQDRPQGETKAGPTTHSVNHEKSFLRRAGVLANTGQQAIDIPLGQWGKGHGDRGQNEAIRFDLGIASSLRQASAVGSVSFPVNSRKAARAAL